MAEIEHTAENDAGMIEAGKAGVSDTETLAAEPGQSVAEPADRVMRPGTFSPDAENDAPRTCFQCGTSWNAPVDRCPNCCCGVGEGCSSLDCTGTPAADAPTSGPVDDGPREFSHSSRGSVVATGTPTGHGLGSLVTRLLAEHWPNSGVNGWYLADLLRDNGVRVTPATGTRTIAATGGIRPDCPTCTWPNRKTVNMVCRTCGFDYGTTTFTASDGDY